MKTITCDKCGKTLSEIKHQVQAINERMGFLSVRVIDLNSEGTLSEPIISTGDYCAECVDILKGIIGGAW